MPKTLSIFEGLLTAIKSYSGPDIVHIAKTHNIELPEDTVYATGSLLFQLRSTFFDQIGEWVTLDEMQEFKAKFLDTSNDEIYWWMKEFDEGSHLLYELFEQVSRWVVKTEGLTTKQKVCVDFYYLIVLVEKWRRIFGENSDHSIFLITLRDNLTEKLHVWYYEETSKPILRSYPWVTNLSAKELAEGLPPIIKLSRMASRTKADLTTMLERNVYLRYIRIDELIKTFGLEETLPIKLRPQKQRSVILEFIRGAGTTLHHICFRFALDIATATARLTELFDKDLLNSTDRKNPYSGFLIAKPSQVTAKTIDTPNPPSIKPTPRPGVTWGIHPVQTSGGFQILGGSKGKTVSFSSASGKKITKFTQSSKPDKSARDTTNSNERIAACLDKLAEKDRQGVTHRHVYLFLGITRKKKVKAEEPRPASEIDVRLKKAKKENDLFYPMVDIDVAGRSETFVVKLLEESPWKGKKQAKSIFAHPAFQKFVQLFGKHSWEKREGNRYKTFKSSPSIKGKPGIKIAPWLVEYMPDLTETMLPIQEKILGLKK